MNSLDAEYFLGATAATLAGTSIALTFDARLREGQSILENFTVAKVQRAALYAIASLVPVITALASRDKAATLLSLAGTAFCLYGASQIRDYEDAKELQIMKSAAENMNFRELIQTHGLDRLIKYQMGGDLPAKFALAYANQPFSVILRETSLKQIAQYQLAPISISGLLHDKFVHELEARKLDFLRERNLINPLYKNLLSEEMYTGLTQLNIDLANIDQVYDRTLQELDIAYSERTEKQDAEFDERERNIFILASSLGEQVSYWDGNTDHMFRDAGNDWCFAEATERSAERAELERHREELKRDRENPFWIALGAVQQYAYDSGVIEAKKVKKAALAMLEKTLADIISRNENIDSSAIGNEAWDGNHQNISRDTSTGSAVVEAAQLGAEQAAARSLIAHLSRENKRV